MFTWENNFYFTPEIYSLCRECGDLSPKKKTEKQQPDNENDPRKSLKCAMVQK